MYAGKWEYTLTLFYQSCLLCPEATLTYHISHNHCVHEQRPHHCIVWNSFIGIDKRLEMCVRGLSSVSEEGGMGSRGMCGEQRGSWKLKLMRNPRVETQSMSMSQWACGFIIPCGSYENKERELLMWKRRCRHTCEKLEQPRGPTLEFIRGNQLPSHCAT